MRDAAAEFNLGTVLDQQDRWDEARAHYEQALAINPFHTRAMNNLGAGLDRRGDTAAALRLFERAIAIAPDAADLHVNYGTALTQARRFDDAVRDADDGHRPRPARPDPAQHPRHRVRVDGRPAGRAQKTPSPAPSSSTRATPMRARQPRAGVGAALARAAMGAR